MEVYGVLVLDLNIKNIVGCETIDLDALFYIFEYVIYLLLK